MKAYIYHVALGVGMGTEEHCPFDREQIAAWRGHLDRALAAPQGELIPGMSEYAMSARTVAGELLCTVGRIRDGLGLCTFAVVGKSRNAARAWQALHDGYPQFAASVGDVPRAPYCAVRAEYGLAQDRDAGAWLDAYQLAIAWAWIEGHKP